MALQQALAAHNLAHILQALEQHGVTADAIKTVPARKLNAMIDSTGLPESDLEALAEVLPAIKKQLLMVPVKPLFEYFGT